MNTKSSTEKNKKSNSNKYTTNIIKKGSSILPDRFNSITEVSPYPINSEGLNSTSKLVPPIYKIEKV